MHCKIQLVMCTDDGREETVTDVITLTKDCQRCEHLGLTLAEAKQLLTTIEQQLLEQQVDTFLASRSHCATCGTALKVKGDLPERSAHSLAPSNSRVSVSTTVAVSVA